MIQKFKRKFRKKIGGIGRRLGLVDDFDWSVYCQEEYKEQIGFGDRECSLVIPEGKFYLNNGEIILDADLLPLNKNHKVLYETIYCLKPETILEVGCGCGDHLANLKKFLPDLQLSGIDLLPRQLEFLFQRHPELKNQAGLFVSDITDPEMKPIKADLVFTQAVLMHIQRYKHYLSALKNIFNSSKRFVVLIEGWTRHNFVEDIKKISKQSDFAWKNIYFFTNDTGK